MSLPNPQLLHKAFAEVLQQLTFLFASPDADVDTDMAKPESDWMTLILPFEGPETGEVGLRLPRSLQIEVAANFLGLDSESPEAELHSEDASRELLNVVTGHVLSDWAGENSVFNLGPARLLEKGSDHHSDLSESFDVEGNPAILTFSMRRPAP
jgi:hypothetical protein